jgi:hypothetical protein
LFAIVKFLLLMELNFFQIKLRENETRNNAE